MGTDMAKQQDGQPEHDRVCAIGKQLAAGLTHDQIMANMREWEAKQMREFGWYAHYVGGNDSLPIGVNYHTHGFGETFGHPDLQIVVNCGIETCHSIFHNIADRIRAVEVFDHGKTYSGVIKNWDVLMHVALDNGCPVLRIILPDQIGKLLKDEMTGKIKFQYMDLGDVTPDLLRATPPK